MLTNLNKKWEKWISYDLSLLLYKIFNDALFLLLVGFSALLLAEGLLPGFSLNYLSFTKMILLIAANLGVIIYLGKRNGVSFDTIDFKKNKLWLVLFFIFFIFLLVRALYKFSWWEIIIIIISSLLILYYFYKKE